MGCTIRTTNVVTLIGKTIADFVFFVKWLIIQLSLNEILEESIEF